MSNVDAYADELDGIERELDQLALELEVPAYKAELQAVNTAIHAAEAAWSKSNLGYHARTYYHDLSTPPPTEIFSKEWGLMMRSDSPWKTFNESDVRELILSRAGNVEISRIQEDSDRVRSRMYELKEALASILTSALASQPDSYLEKMSRDVQDTSAPAANAFARNYLPRGQQMSRDMVAIDQGLVVAPHQALMAEFEAVEAPYTCARGLARYARSAAAHLRRRPVSAPPLTSAPQLGSRIFIGHGGSPQWRELKEFLQDRLGLQADEFNRVPVAGTSTTARLSQMMDTAAFACLVMTAEDEMADGAAVARSNVVHEVGLFQGRLGFEKAIVLLEEGCSEFSNITGLSQLRYPAGRISAIYEDLRQVLEREGLI